MGSVLRRGFREGTSKAEVRLFESTTSLACALEFLIWPCEFWKIACAFLSEFLQRILPRIVRPCLSRVSAPLKNSCPEFTPRFVGIPLQFLFSDFHADFLLAGGDQKFSMPVSPREKSLAVIRKGKESTGIPKSETDWKAVVPKCFPAKL